MNHSWLRWLYLGRLDRHQLIEGDENEINFNVGDRHKNKVSSSLDYVQRNNGTILDRSIKIDSVSDKTAVHQNSSIFLNFGIFFL